MSLTDTSRYMSLILRHKPETIGISLDEHGWANVDELIAGIAKTHEFNMDILEEIVKTDNKQRYSFNEDKTLIRANQGHSIPVDVELEKQEPPKYLYHGTGEKYRSSIDEQGLIPKSRLYVHLSTDIDTAIKVGSRYGKPVVYRVWSGLMQMEGFDFYKSVNGVWLTKEVPTKFIKRETFDEKEIQEVVKEIESVLLRTELDDEALEDTSRADVIFELMNKYSWEVLQQALFKILQDDNKSDDDYYQMAVVLWFAVLESQTRKRNGQNKLKFKKKTIIALLYYRLRNVEYAENTIWSITCELYHLDYCNSDYDPMKDERIIAKAKANAAQAIPEMIEIATSKSFEDNKKNKHSRYAKIGWYRYDTRFALPVYSENGDIERYNVFSARLLIRHASSGKMYLYDVLEIKKETSKSCQE